MLFLSVFNLWGNGERGKNVVYEIGKLNIVCFPVFFLGSCARSTFYVARLSLQSSGQNMWQKWDFFVLPQNEEMFLPWELNSGAELVKRLKFGFYGKRTCTKKNKKTKQLEETWFTEYCQTTTHFRIEKRTGLDPAACFEGQEWTIYYAENDV
jgi:hypothetical protein